MWVEIDERTKKRRIPGMKFGNEGRICQSEAAWRRQRSQLRTVEAGKVRNEEKNSICAPSLSHLKRMRDLVALSHEPEILSMSIKGLGRS
jgi:hypothetical protein